MQTIERLILFDIDGTLLKTKGAGRQSTRAAMLEVFGTASTIDTHHFGGKTDWYTLSELLRAHGHTPDSVGQHMDAFVEAMGRHMARYILESPATALPGALAETGADVSAVQEAAQAVCAGIAECGYDTELLGVEGPDLDGVIARLRDDPPQLVFNLCESMAGDVRNEVVLPSVLDMLRVIRRCLSPARTA